MIQSTRSNNYSSTVGQSGPSYPTFSSPDAALSPQSDSALAQFDHAAISAEARDVEGRDSNERVDSLLQGIASWDESSEGKSSSGDSKQAGSFFGKLLENFNRARNAPAVRRTQGAQGAQRAADPRQSRCQQAAGQATSIGSAVGLLPGPVGVAGRVVQGAGSVMSLVGCPVLESETVQQVVRRVESRVDETARGMTELVYGQDYDQNGTPDWVTGDRN